MKYGMVAGLTVFALSTAIASAQPAALPAEPVPVASPYAGAPVEASAPLAVEVIHEPVPMIYRQEPASTAEVYQPLGPCGDSLEYVLWWIKDSSLPPLVTTNRIGAAPVLGQPGTVTIFGGAPLDNEERSGGRFRLGSPLGLGFGIEGTYFFLGTRTTGVSVSGSGAPGSSSVGLPFVDAVTGQEQVQLVSAPGIGEGTVTASESARMQGVEANVIANWLCGANYQVDGLVGFRYLEVDEGISVGERLILFSPPGGIAFDAADQIDGHNRFYGGQVGIRLDLRKGGVFMDLQGKLAVGETYEVVRINGVTSITPNVLQHSVQAGGVFALPSNSGRFTHEAFALVPEGMIRAGFLYRDNSRFFVGYNFLYLTALARPGDQIDRTLNAGQIPMNLASGTALGPNRPEFAFQHGEFWAQGLVIGLEYRY